MESKTKLVTVVDAPRLSDETNRRVNEVLDLVAACGNRDELHNKLIPTISEQQSRIPRALQYGIVDALHKKMQNLGERMPIAELRAIVFPPAMPRSDAVQGQLPDWALPFCYVTTGDYFYNTDNGQRMTMTGFQAAYGERMPVVNGRRDNSAERCLHFWGMPKVHDVAYRPDQGTLFEWKGVQYANSYVRSSVPAAAPVYSEAGLAGIHAFYAHMFDMCGRRADVFNTLLYWYAHNVQRPGVKIRWAPIIKGVNGDGKTLCVEVLRAAMGYRNVSTTSNATISNSGGFTDWATRAAVNVIEEIMLTGKQRHQLYNAMKEFITNNVVDINVKGGKPRQDWNTTNHLANTNHNDALPLESTDRRWFVVFTPWASLADMRAYCGLDETAWKARTDAIDYAKDHCAGEFRAWLLSLPIPSTFDVNGSAMVTPEKRRMMASGKDDVESVIESVIADGVAGVTESVISTAHLTAELRRRSLSEGFTVPQSSTLAHMLTRMGYSRVEKQVKYNGWPLRIWVKNGVELTNDEIRLRLPLI